MSRLRVLSDEQCALIADLQNRMADVPDVFGPWQTIWTWHRRLAGDGTWDRILERLLANADAAGIVDWAASVDSTIVRAHQHATNTTRHTGGWVELHESFDRAA